MSARSRQLRLRASCPPVPPAMLPLQLPPRARQAASWSAAGPLLLPSRYAPSPAPLATARAPGGHLDYGYSEGSQGTKARAPAATKREPWAHAEPWHPGHQAGYGDSVRQSGRQGSGTRRAHKQPPMIASQGFGGSERPFIN